MEGFPNSDRVLNLLHGKTTIFGVYHFGKGSECQLLHVGNDAEIRRCSVDQESFPVLIFQAQLPVRLIRWPSAINPSLRRSSSSARLRSRFSRSRSA